MQQESINGNDGLYGRNDGHASGKLTASETSSQDELKKFFEAMNEFKHDHLDLRFSNRRLDFYLFYYSSKL